MTCRKLLRAVKRVNTLYLIKESEKLREEILELNYCGSRLYDWY